MMHTIVIEEKAFPVAGVNALSTPTQDSVIKPSTIPARAKGTVGDLIAPPSIVLKKGLTKNSKSGGSDSEEGGITVAINYKTAGDTFYRHNRRESEPKPNQGVLSPKRQVVLSPRISFPAHRKSREGSARLPCRDLSPDRVASELIRQASAVPLSPRIRAGSAGVKMDRKTKDRETTKVDGLFGKNLAIAAGDRGPHDQRTVPSPKSVPPIVKMNRAQLDRRIMSKQNTHGPIHDSAGSAFGPLRIDVTKLPRDAGSLKDSSDAREHRKGSWDGSSDCVKPSLVDNNRISPGQSASGASQMKKLQCASPERCVAADQDNLKPQPGTPHQEGENSQITRQFSFSTELTKNKPQEPCSPHMGHESLTPRGTDGSLTPEGRSEIDATFMSSTEVKWGERTSGEYTSKNQKAQWDLMRSAGPDIGGADLTTTTDFRRATDLMMTTDLTQTADIMRTGDVTWDLLQSGDVRWDCVREGNAEKVYTRTSPLPDIDGAAAGKTDVINGFVHGSFGEAAACSVCPCSGSGARSLKNLVAKLLLGSCCSGQENGSNAVGVAQGVPQGGNKTPDRVVRASNRLPKEQPDRNIISGRYSRRHQFMMNMIEEGRLSGRQEP